MFRTGRRPATYGGPRRQFKALLLLAVWAIVAYGSEEYPRCSDAFSPALPLKVLAVWLMFVEKQ